MSAQENTFVSKDYSQNNSLNQNEKPRSQPELGYLADCIFSDVSLVLDLLVPAPNPFCFLSASEVTSEHLVLCGENHVKILIFCISIETADMEERKMSNWNAGKKMLWLMKKL